MTINANTSYPLSPMQHGLLFHELYAPAAGVNILQTIIRLPEAVDGAALAEAWRQVVKRHPMLRTSFHWTGSTLPQQRVQPEVALPCRQEDWRGLTGAEQSRRLEQFLLNDRRQGFNLHQAPLLRLALIRTGDADYRCVWTCHHLLLDGRALMRVLDEVFALYEAQQLGQAATLPPPQPYQHYVEWWQTQPIDSWADFWRAQLRDVELPTPLGIDRQPQATTAAPPDFERQELHLSARLTAALQNLAQAYNVTLNTLLHGAWALLLSRYSGRPDVVFGATRAGRYGTIPEAEAVVGPFINTLPIRVGVLPEETSHPWLAALRANMLTTRAYEHAPLLNIQEWCALPPHQPIFDSLVVFQPQTFQAALQAGHPRRANWEVDLRQPPFYPLTLNAYGGSRLQLHLTFDRRRFDAPSIGRLLGHLRQLLTAFVTMPNTPLSQLPLLTAAEEHELLYERNQTEANYPNTQTLPRLFEQQAAQTPAHIALTWGTEHLTYQALDERANQLAHHLLANGVKPEQLVAIYLERSPEMVVALLAVLKAGAAYLPLDPAQPPARTRFMLDDAAITHLITTRALRTDNLQRVPSLILLDAAPDDLAGQPLTAPAVTVTPDSLAYCLYTSGSTGQPKGVLIEHRQVVRLLVNDNSPFNFTRRDVWTMFHAYSFDFSVWEMYGALLFGGRLVIVPAAATRDPHALLDLLAGERVTVLNQTPGAFYALAEAARARPELQLALHTVIFGGEALQPLRLQSWWRQFPHIKLINMYGITETTVHVTFKEITTGDIEQNVSNIGRPIPTTRLYILDDHQQPLPVGVPGEIYVGGDGVGRGYLNRPDLTRQKFIPNPYRTGERLYRSGDLARWLPAGDLEYLGRLDQQVQIRGYRVELGEIEARLLAHPAVQEAVVVAGNPTAGATELSAYVVPAVPVTLTELRRHLAQTLPAYMLPAHFVQMAALPLTGNGKIDRRALPPPQPSRPALATLFAPPRTATETVLAQIWADVLKLERVGIHDNFFELGGHSLLATQVAARIRTAFHLEMPLHHIFEQPTIARLAPIIIHLESQQVDDATVEQLLAELENET